MSSYVDPTKARGFVQPGGPGNPWVALHDETRITAPSGGGRSYESDYSRGEYVGSRRTGNRERTSFTIESRKTYISAVRALAEEECPPGAGAFYGCAEQGIGNFRSGDIFVDAGPGNKGVSENIVNGVEENDPKLMDTLELSAGAWFEIRSLVHNDIKGTLSLSAFNHVLKLGRAHCAGDCGPGASKHDIFLAVGPGISPATIPRIFYTKDRFKTVVAQTIAAVANGVAEQVAVSGDRVIVAVSGTNGGVYTAPLAAVKLGTATFTQASGAGGAKLAILAVGASTVIVCGAAGDVRISRDSGFSFTSLASGTASSLNEIAAKDENLIWIGGAAGTLLRLKNLQSIGTVAVTGIAAAAITALAVPPGRVDEVYVGTATGDIHRSRDGLSGTPTWETLGFDKPTGGSSIPAIDFTEAMGAVMAVVQNNSTPTSRVLVDYSGGAMGAGAVAVQDFTSPVNAGFTSIAATGANSMIVVGALQSTYGYIGHITG